MIHLEYVRKTGSLGREYGIVLDDVSFTAHAQSLTMVLGSAPATITMLMALIAGYDTPDSGTITVADVDVSRVSTRGCDVLRQRTLGLLYPTHNLLPSLTVAANLVFPARINRQPVSTESYERVLDLFAIRSLLSYYPDALTVLERQRVALASLALAGRSVIVCEEPAAHLNSRDLESLTALLRLCVRELDMTVLALTRNPVCASHADHVIVLDDERVAGELHTPDLTAIYSALSALRGDVC
ncbi:ATP-binding cassette domain-containing protein [Trueperella sp. LYQ143]|uniref:ATP-binding cassette domain-containing protein n=1 Tax=unclassified Trueperella TaxID=2630174 RepID=UPI00398302C9